MAPMLRYPQRREMMGMRQFGLRLAPAILLADASPLDVRGFLKPFPSFDRGLWTV